MFETLLIATVTGLATGLGALPFLVWEKIPRRLYDAVLGVGAGLMISAATLGLIGHALEQVRPGGVLDRGVLAQIVVGFTSGVLLLLLMDRVIPHHHAGGHHDHIGGHEHHHEIRQGMLITGAMTIHRIPEGFAIGAGFAAGTEQPIGWLLAIAVAFQNVCEGAVMAAPLRAAGWSSTRCLAAVSATGLAIPIAAVAGYAAAAQLQSALPFSMSLAAGALIYLISNEIIPETHSHGNEGPATLGLVAGFLATVVIMALGHHA